MSKSLPIPGPDAAAALAKGHPHSSVEKVWAPRPSTEFRVRAYRLKKAMATGDRESIRKAASDMTHDERDEVLAEIQQDEIRKSADIRKGEWCREHHRYDGPHERPKAKGLATVALGEGAVRRAYRPAVGAVMNFTEADGTVRHAKLRGWGKAGASLVSAEGEFHVAWSALREGVAPAQQAERDAKVRKAQVRMWDALLDTTEMSVAEREQFFADRGLGV